MPDIFIFAEPSEKFTFIGTKEIAKKIVEIFNIETSGQGYAFLVRNASGFTINDNGTVYQIPFALGIEISATYKGVAI